MKQAVAISLLPGWARLVSEMEPANASPEAGGAGRTAAAIAAPSWTSFLQRGQTSTDPEARLAAYRRAQELFQEEMPMIPLYHAPVFSASREAVNGLQISPTGLLRYEKVWKAGRP